MLQAVIERTAPHWGLGTPGPRDVGRGSHSTHVGCCWWEGISGKQCWCVVVLWASYPELLGARSLQPILPSLLFHFLEWSQSGLAPVCHCITLTLVPAMAEQEHIISAYSTCQGLLPPTHRQAWLLGGPAAASLLLHMLQSLLCWERCSGGTAGQGLGALAKAMRTCNLGFRQGAPRTASACPDPLLLSSRWVPPQAPYLQGQCSLPW